MFDPLIQHYRRLNNIKPSAEIASVFSGSNKRRKTQKTPATTLSSRNALARHQRPQSAMVSSGYTNPVADRNNNYNDMQMRRSSTNNLNKIVGPRISNSWSNLNHNSENIKQGSLFQQTSGTAFDLQVGTFKYQTLLHAYLSTV